jgi:hypothetical protein
MLVQRAKHQLGHNEIGRRKPENANPMERQLYYSTSWHELFDRKVLRMPYIVAVPEEKVNSKSCFDRFLLLKY